MNNDATVQTEVPITLIDNFPEHPFHVREDEAMQELVQSIKENGVLTPCIVCPKEDDRFELISGHRRKFACELAGATTIPVIVKTLDKEAAVITMVDSNLQRENVLPSEKAFAYKMKLEALKHQGVSLSQVATKSDTAAEIGKHCNESRDKVFRYIRLTNLTPELLQMVDDKRIAFSPAVELSYLTEKEQQTLLDAIRCEDCTPSLSQSQRLKMFSKQGRLTQNDIYKILTEEKPNQKERIKIDTDMVKKYFPKSYSVSQMEKTLIKLLEDWAKKREQNKDAR